MKKQIVALAVLASLTMATPAAAASLPPRDECARLSGFAAFRARLNDVIRRRDGAGLIALTASDIRSSFGGDNGRADFIREWTLRNPARSRIWPELATIMRLGCTASGADGASSPFMFESLPDAHDAFSTVVALGAGIALRERRSASSRIVRRLDWEILTTENDGPNQAWVAVRTDRGERGFVRRDLVRSPIDYRAIFSRDNGRWQLSAFIAGD